MIVMSTLLNYTLDMNMINILPFLCFLYVLLPRKIRNLPLTTTYKDLEEDNDIVTLDANVRLNESLTENLNDFSHGLDDEQLNETELESGLTFENGYSDASRGIFLSPQKSGKKDEHVNGKALKFVAPEYMMDLYRRFSRNKIDLPSSNIVRSFRNINSEDSTHYKDNRDLIDFNERTKSQVHVLTFNISSVSRREKINLAELRIFTLIERDKNAYYFGVDRTVSVLDIVTDAEIDDSLTDSKYEPISSRRVYGFFSAWETFDLTSSVEKWVKSGKSIHKIEIRLENFWWAFSFGSMDIKTVPNDSKEPLLLVYSNDDSKHSEHVHDRHDLISHETSSYHISGDFTSGITQSKPSDIYQENSSEPKRGRQKRSKPFRRSSLCRRRPMFVDFEAINWHTWIIAPRGYQAYQCVGKCYFPISENLSPSKHAIIQSTLHSHFPKKAVRACCVPTKLDPISILYIDEQGVITYKYRYDGMVVAECGCR